MAALGDRKSARVALSQTCDRGARDAGTGDGCYGFDFRGGRNGCGNSPAGRESLGACCGGASNSDMMVVIGRVDG